MLRLWEKWTLVARPPRLPSRHARKVAEQAAPARQETRGRTAPAGFSKGGAVTVVADHNPVIDDGAPRSTGGINSASSLCDMIGVRYEVERPSSVYYQGWGQKCADPKVVKCTWTLRAKDEGNNPV